jgi:thiol:disulfide interchange protein DsbA
MKTYQLTMKNKIKRVLQKTTLSLALVLATGSFAHAQLALPSAPASKAPAAAANATPAPQASFRDGVEYRTLPAPQATEAKGKIEVLEFFWYGCPHCHDFDPELQAWVKRQGKDVSFKRIPIAFREDFLPHSQMFYAFEELGKGDAYTDKVMNAIHGQRKQLLKESEIADWVATQQGVDAKAFMTAFKSFGVITKAKAANQKGSAFRIDGVPTVAIQGKYMTSPSIAGSRTRALETMDYLVAKARKEK